MYQKTKGFLCMLLGIFFVLGFSGTAKVSAAQGVLAHETLHMYAGASVDMDEEISDPTYRIQKITIVTPENSDSIVVSNKHILKAKNAGTTTAQITLVSTKNEEETLDCQVMIIVHEVEKLTMAYGSATRLAAFDYYNPYQEKYTFSNQGAVFNQDYQVVVRGLKTVDVHVTKNNKTFLVAQITVEALSLKNAVVARAVNTTPYQTEVLGYTALGSEKISYISDNTAIADAAEAVVPKKVGTCNITVRFTAANDDTADLPMQFIVTNPSFTQKRVILAKGLSKQVSLRGCSAYSTIENTQPKGTKAYFKNNNTIYAKAAGIVKLYLVVDGKQVEIDVIVSNPRFTQNAVAMYKGASKNLSIAGLQKGYSKISFRSLNKKLMTISKSGKIKAKKVGYGYIEVTSDGKTFRVLVQIAKKKAYQATRKAIQISKRKTTYSQARRMSKKYYDCSSLVSRVYRQYGQYFGQRRGWSPVAAGIGYWCTNHKKVLFKKAASYKTLLPGDLIFYSYEKNGRYRNISHIEMYVGNGKNVSASSSYGRVVHYDYHTSCTVLIARPCK